MIATFRTATLTLLTTLALVATAGAASATHGDPCPEYTNEVVLHEDENGEYGVAYNEDAQSRVSLGSLYVTVDELWLVTGPDYLFSIWLHAESNGERGLQRHDGYCGDPGYDDSNSDGIRGF